MLGGNTMADEQKDYYKILNVDSKATPKEIKDAYRQLAREAHPDQHPEKMEEFKVINEAYEVLREADKRAVYDLKQQRSANAAAQAAQKEAPPPAYEEKENAAPPPPYEEAKNAAPPPPYEEAKNAAPPPAYEETENAAPPPPYEQPKNAAPPPPPVFDEAKKPQAAKNEAKPNPEKAAPVGGQQQPPQAEAFYPQPEADYANMPLFFQGLSQNNINQNSARISALVAQADALEEKAIEIDQWVGRATTDEERGLLQIQRNELNEEAQRIMLQVKKEFEILPLETKVNVLFNQDFDPKMRIKLLLTLDQNDRIAILEHLPQEDRKTFLNELDEHSLAQLMVSLQTLDGKMTKSENDAFQLLTTDKKAETINELMLTVGPQGPHVAYQLFNDLSAKEKSDLFQSKKLHPLAAAELFVMIPDLKMQQTLYKDADLYTKKMILNEMKNDPRQLKQFMSGMSLQDYKQCLSLLPPQMRFELQSNSAAAFRDKQYRDASSLRNNVTMPKKELAEDAPEVKQSKQTVYRPSGAV